ncbi:MAG: hypothetical protein HRT42_12565 [Campylobacteraceae bacterium]|nr:hypothetical protein [Campylobacteraceae bacterium]
MSLTSHKTIRNSFVLNDYPPIFFIVSLALKDRYLNPVSTVSLKKFYLSKK